MRPKGQSQVKQLYVDLIYQYGRINFEQLPPDPESLLFQFYGDKEIDFL
jgi:hypothetical protein